MKHGISVVVPAYNEEACVDELAARLQSVADARLDKYEFEFIIIENGSEDRTFEKLIDIREKDARFKVLRLSRNFGMEGAVIAGMRHASGDALVLMCADLQDPPELIPTFIDRWTEGYQNVYGVITRRSDEGWLRQTLTRWFYWILNRVVAHPVPRNVSDFRLVDRRLYEPMNRLHERNRLLRAMWGWFGFRSIGVPYQRPPRFAGSSTYRLSSNIAFALHAIISSSVVPLKLIPLTGIALGGLSFAVLAAFIVRWVFFGVPFEGFGTIVALMLLLFGMVFLFMGVMSEYLGMVVEEVRARPHFIVDSAFGFDDKGGKQAQ